MDVTTEPTFSVSAQKIIKFLAAVCGLTQILLLIDSNFSHPNEFQQSDYMMTFYVAGHLSAVGRQSELYPPPEATAFVNAPFDKAAHTLLHSLPPKITAIYMYSPLVAFFFAPLSMLSPTWSLLLWQLLSLIGLCLSCKMLADATEGDFPQSLLLCSLFAPVFITLWSGQLGLALGLLPLCFGYFLLLERRTVAAGLIWSLLLLKPQYLVLAGFITLVLVLKTNYRLLFGLIAGITLLAAANFLLFSPDLIMRWFTIHKLSDTLFTDSRYGVPAHLVTSLPADVLLLLPVSSRSAWKWPVYFSALILWLIGLWYCWKIHSSQWQWRTKISLSVAIGCVLSSLALPHLLYYDLCILIPAGFVFLHGNTLNGRLVTVPARLGWLSISLYLPIFLLLKSSAMSALVLELILLVLFAILLAGVSRALVTSTA